MTSQQKYLELALYSPNITTQLIDHHEKLNPMLLVETHTSSSKPGELQINKKLVHVFLQSFFLLSANMEVTRVGRFLYRGLIMVSVEISLARVQL